MEYCAICLNELSITYQKPDYNSGKVGILTYTCNTCLTVNPHQLTLKTCIDKINGIGTRVDFIEGKEKE